MSYAISATYPSDAKIMAIKLIRETFQCGLIEAKTMVESGVIFSLAVSNMPWPLNRDIYEALAGRLNAAGLKAAVEDIDLPKPMGRVNSFWFLPHAVAPDDLTEDQERQAAQLILIHLGLVKAAKVFV